MAVGVECFDLLYKPEFYDKKMLPSFLRRGRGWLGRQFFFQKSMRNDFSLFEPPLNPLLGKGGDFKAA
jgi:hypothetical protein